MTAPDPFAEASKAPKSCSRDQSADQRRVRRLFQFADNGVTDFCCLA
jgi:hypothetical protein